MEDGFDIGLFGLDLFTGNLARSLSEHDVSVATCPFAGAAAPVRDLSAQGILSVQNARQLVAVLRRPRVLVVRAQPGGGSEIPWQNAMEALESGDILIDASDSWFRDTSARARAAAGKRIHYLNLGLARSENSERPLLMAGGRRDVFDRVSRLLEAASPEIFGVQGRGHLGAGPSGHFIKMTHAAIECAVRQIVGECQTILDRGLGAEAGDLLDGRRDDPLFDYLRRPILTSPPECDRQMAEWAARAAAELEVPALTIQASSGAPKLMNHDVLTEAFCQPVGSLPASGERLVAAAHGALRAAIIISYAEGLGLLATASERLQFHIDLPGTLRVWRAGARLRGRMLEDIQAAFETTPGLPNLLFDDDFSGNIMELQEPLRQAVWQADEWNMPTPALAAALCYIDTLRDAWLPINLIQPEGLSWEPPGRENRVAAALHSEWEEDDSSATDPRLA